MFVLEPCLSMSEEVISVSSWTSVQGSNLGLMGIIKGCTNLCAVCMFVSHRPSYSCCVTPKALLSTEWLTGFSSCLHFSLPPVVDIFPASCAFSAR